MRTRTLLLLAVTTGLAILIAGGIQLIRASNQDESVPTYEIGQPVEVGDMTVTVSSATEDDGVLSVQLDIGGVDDPDGTDAFRLILPGDDEPVRPQSASDDGACGGTSVEVATCELRFGVADASSDARTLHYQRGDESARWSLAG